MLDIHEVLFGPTEAPPSDDANAVLEYRQKLVARRTREARSKEVALKGKGDDDDDDNSTSYRVECNQASMRRLYQECRTLPIVPLEEDASRRSPVLGQPGRFVASFITTSSNFIITFPSRM